MLKKKKKTQAQNPLQLGNMTDFTMKMQAISNRAIREGSREADTLEFKPPRSKQIRSTRLSRLTADSLTE